MGTDSTTDVSKALFHFLIANISQRVLHTSGFHRDAATLLAFQLIAADDEGLGRLWVPGG